MDVNGRYARDREHDRVRCQMSGHGVVAGRRAPDEVIPGCVQFIGGARSVGPHAAIGLTPVRFGVFNETLDGRIVDEAFEGSEPDAVVRCEEVEEDVCFSYEVDKKGVGDQMLVEFKTKVYDYSSYFTKTAVYNSVEDAVNAREELIREVMQ